MGQRLDGWACIVGEDTYIELPKILILSKVNRSSLVNIVIPLSNKFQNTGQSLENKFYEDWLKE